MREHDGYSTQDEPEKPFWQHDEEIAVATFFGDPTGIRLKAHMAEEPFFRATEGTELVSLSTMRGTRTYVLARPYIMEPDYRLTIGLYPQPEVSGAIGEVISSDQIGMKHREIGQSQAWLYPQDRTLIVWECYLHDWCRATSPDNDPTLKALWEGFEGFLLRHLPAVERIVTPSWEPIYDEDREAWPRFLAQRGYEPLSQQAFAKKVSL
jgi:hypothetical protein